VVVASERVGNLSGVARPSRALRKILGDLSTGQKPIIIDHVIDSAVAVDVVAKLLTRTMEECTTADGRVDMKDVAARVLRVMQENQR